MHLRTTSSMWGRDHTASISIRRIVTSGLVGWALIAWLGAATPATAQPVVHEASSTLAVGIAIDAVFVQHTEALTVVDGVGFVDRALPDGATLLTATVNACGTDVAASPRKGRGLDASEATVGRVVFPIPACAAGNEARLSWSYAMRASQAGARFAVTIPAARSIEVELAGGGSIWSVKSETHRLATRYDGETVAHIKATGDRDTFALRWELAGPDAPQVNAVAWSDPAGDGACMLTSAPPSKDRGADPVVLHVVVDAELSLDAWATVDAWYAATVAALGKDDRVNFAFYDSRERNHEAGPRASSSRFAAEAVGHAIATPLVPSVWFAGATGKTTWAPSLSTVLQALRDETTPARWRRLVVVFGGAGPLAKAHASKLARGDTPLRVIVVGDGPAPGWPSWVAFRRWGEVWGPDGAFGWPRAVQRPLIGRVAVGPAKGGAALGDLWPDGTQRWSDYRPKGARAGTPRCFNAATIHVEAEVGEAWLVEDVPVPQLEPGTLPYTAAATVARLQHLAAGGRLTAAVSKLKAAPVNAGATLAWPQPAPFGTKAGARPPKAKHWIATTMDEPSSEDISAWRRGGKTRPSAAASPDKSPKPRAFVVRMIRSRVGGRSGTQLRDRLERNRRDLEAALGAVFPRDVMRRGRLVVTLVVSPRGAVSAPTVARAGEPDSAAPPALAELFGRLAFDPLTGGDGSDTRFVIDLDLR